MSEILVVDDDAHLREVVCYALTRAGYTIREASDGRAALAAFRAAPPTLVVLDVMMPELDGLEVCREIRKTSRTPIIFLSSRDEELDRILGLELGGDDYMTKPFSTRELVSRVKAVLRRAEPTPPAGSPSGQAAGAPGPATPLLQAGRLRMDPMQHRCWSGEEEILLTVTEFSLLQVLLRHPGRVYTREELTSRAYGEDHHISDRTLDSHIRRIRQKFRDTGLDPVETVHGLGYRLRHA